MFVKVAVATVLVMFVGTVDWLVNHLGAPRDAAASAAALAAGVDRLFDSDKELLDELFSGQHAPPRPMGRVDVIARPQRGTLFGYEAAEGTPCMAWIERDGGNFSMCNGAPPDPMLTPYQGDGAMVGMTSPDLDAVRVKLADGRRVSARTVPSSETSLARFFVVEVTREDGPVTVEGMQGDEVAITERAP